ncbi:MAG: hypothetical protein GWN00_18935, partial [Aliifodinibius sp.]|nr:hypothetical protein [Fodinibius sp.]NIV13142.1 hypothetical protein [Fodinibius sp.]NIY26807.1 hypothetical protein [Fodinibius sp.]
MKIILFLCLSIILIPVVVTAAPVNLTWDTYTDTADGFKLYWGEATRNYCCWLDLGLVTESGVVDIPYFNFITLTAYRICTQELIDYTDPNDPTYQHPCVDIGLNGLWESEYSNEIYWSWVAMAYNGSISWQWIEPLPRITEGLTV